MPNVGLGAAGPGGMRGTGCSSRPSIRVAVLSTSLGPEVTVPRRQRQDGGAAQPSPTHEDPLLQQQQRYRPPHGQRRAGLLPPVNTAQVYQEQRSEQPRKQQQRMHPELQPQSQPARRVAERSTVQYAAGPDQDWSLPTGLAVTWLGTSSGAPTKERNISCTLVRLPTAVYMVDCGEGSARQALGTGVHLEQVDTIFITHLHGDHCFGIGGMLAALCEARQVALQRQQQQQQQPQGEGSDPSSGPGALRLVGPPQLARLLAAMLSCAGVLQHLTLPVYVTEFVEVDSDGHDWQPLPGVPAGAAFVRRLPPTRQLPVEQWPQGLASRLAQTGLDWQRRIRRPPTFQAKTGLLWDVPCGAAHVTAAQLQHRVPCWGYVFDEPQQQQTQCEHDQQQQQLQQQQQQLHSQPLSGGRRVLVLGDTVDSSCIAPAALGADLVAHEATYASGMETKAAIAQHSTAWMAGKFAAALRARALVLTHFSARYESALANGPPPGHGRRSGAGGRGGEVRRVRAWEIAAAEAAERAADERAVAALAREAGEHFRRGQVLLAVDLFTAHVPARLPRGEVAPES